MAEGENPFHQQREPHRLKAIREDGAAPLIDSLGAISQPAQHQQMGEGHGIARQFAERDGGRGLLVHEPIDRKRDEPAEQNSANQGGLVARRGPDFFKDHRTTNAAAGLGVGTVASRFFHGWRYGLWVWKG
jgi:hypothetical protein